MLGKKGRRWARALRAAAALAALTAAALVPASAQATVICPTPNGDTYSTAVLADAPIAYYRLNESSGTAMCDSSAANNLGSYNASGLTYGLAGALIGDADTSVAADGTNGVIGTSGSNNGLTGDHNFTLEGWFRSTGSPRNQALLDIGNSGQGNIAGLTTWTSVGGCTSHGSSFGLDEFSTSNCWDTTPDGVNLYDGQWHYLVVTYSAAGGSVTGYVDGDNLGSQTPGTSSHKFNLTDSPVRLGQWVDTFVNLPFVGGADEVAVYPTALSSARVTAHFRAAGYTPQNTTLPSISGSTTQGQTLSTTNGMWTGHPPRFSYQWKDCDSSGNNCANVSSNGTGSTYTLTSNDVDHTMRVDVTAMNGAGQTTATSPQTGSVSGLGNPAVGLSRSSVDFGSVGVDSTSAPASITVTNVGNATLRLNGATIGGPNPGDFKTASDTCTGAALSPGQTCTVAVTFAPSADGSRQGQLALTDNAPTSPQTVGLGGTGTSLGQVYGAITDTDHNGAPVTGAAVQVCPHGRLLTSACQVTTTDSRGNYAVTGLSPATYDIEADPPGGSGLLRGSATVTVGRGQSVNEDFPLHVPVAFPSNVTISGLSGTYTGGVPTIYWNSPFTITYPIGLPGGMSDGANVTVAIQDTITGTGTRGGGIALEALNTAHFTMKGGHWVLTSEHSGPPAVAAATGCGSPPQPPAFNPLTNPAAFLQNAASQAAQALIPTNQVTADLGGQMHGGANIQDNQEVSVDPVDCIPDPNNPGGQLALCPPGSHRSGNGSSCTPDDTSHYNQFSPRGPSSNGFIDPSGNVYTTHGVPVPGATVWIERSATGKHPHFTRPPAGSALMRPSINPEHTDVAGFFHWDVIAGYYRVQASHAGCTAPAPHRGRKRAPSVFSSVFPIPPPKLGLKLVLSCPGLHRSPSHATLAALRQRKVGGQPLLLSVRVRGTRAGHRPTGLVTIKAGNRILTQVPLNGRTGTVQVVLLGGKAQVGGKLVAVYAGDGYFSPSSSPRERPR